MDLKFVRRDRGMSLFWIILIAAVAVIAVIAIVISTYESGDEIAEGSGEPAATVGEDEAPGASGFTEGESADAPSEEGELPQGDPVGTEEVQPADDQPSGQGGETEQQDGGDGAAPQETEGLAGRATEDESEQEEPTTDEENVTVDRPEPDSEEQSPTPDDEEDAPAAETTESGPQGADEPLINGPDPQEEPAED